MAPGNRWHYTLIYIQYIFIRITDQLNDLFRWQPTCTCQPTNQIQCIPGARWVWDQTDPSLRQSASFGGPRLVRPGRDDGADGDGAGIAWLAETTCHGVTNRMGMGMGRCQWVLIGYPPVIQHGYERYTIYRWWAKYWWPEEIKGKTHQECIKNASKCWISSNLVIIWANFVQRDI